MLIIDSKMMIPNVYSSYSCDHHYNRYPELARSEAGITMPREAKFDVRDSDGSDEELSKEYVKEMMEELHALVKALLREETSDAVYYFSEKFEIKISMELLTKKMNQIAGFHMIMHL